VDSLPVIHVVQEPAQLAVRVGEVPVFGQVDGLPEVHARLRRVLVEKMPALEMIKREDTPGTLFYCDPPYLHETRIPKDAYSYEMTEQEHRDLLTLLLECKGKVTLSGYPSELYDGVLKSWTRHTFDLPNNAAGGEVKRRMTEVLWCNFQNGDGALASRGHSRKVRG
jgi:DNA adenine methylase